MEKPFTQFLQQASFMSFVSLVQWLVFLPGAVPKWKIIFLVGWTTWSNICDLLWQKEAEFAHM
jgi:hypothetical protein